MTDLLLFFPLTSAPIATVNAEQFLWKKETCEEALFFCIVKMYHMNISCAGLESWMFHAWKTLIADTSLVKRFFSFSLSVHRVENVIVKDL